MRQRLIHQRRDPTSTADPNGKSVATTPLVDMTSLIARHDWSKTSLGARETWSSTLRMAVSMILDAKIPMWVAWGPDLTMIYNGAYSGQLGRKHPRALGRPFPKVWREIWPDVSEYVKTTLNGESVYREDMPLRVHRYEKNELIWVSFSTVPIRDEDGTVRGLMTSVWETTGKLRAQQEVVDSRARLLALMQATSNVIYRVTGDWNEMLEVDGRGFLVDTLSPNRNWRDTYLHPLDRDDVIAAIDLAIADRSLYEFEHRVPRADGKLGWILSRAVPMVDADGTIVEWFGTANDITARKEAEAKIAEEARAKDEFLATLAHELRNPLAPVRSGLQLLKQDASASTRQRVLPMLDRQVNHMVHLIDDLMDAARINSGALRLQRKRVDLAMTLSAAFDLSRPAIDEGQHRLRTQLPNHPVWVDGDEVRLAQVFSNLLNNAAMYTPQPGAIDVTLIETGEQAMVSIIDSGIGIAEADQQRLFTLFKRLNPQSTHGDGLGVGLSLAKHLLALQDGTIAVASAGLGKGSCFTVTLPLLSSSSAATSTDKTKRLPRFDEIDWDHLKITVVDDNRDAADSLGALLETFGCQVEIYYSGTSALPTLDRFDPDAILLDIGMPELDGCEVARRIRQQDRHRDALLVAITGWGKPEDRARTSSAGFDHHLVKPVGIDLLMHTLEHAVHSGQRGRS